MLRLVLFVLFVLAAVASPAMAITEQALVDHTRNWLETKGFVLDPVSIVILPNDNQDHVIVDEDGTEWTAVGYSTAVSIPGVLAFREGGEGGAGIVQLAARYGGRRGPLSREATVGAKVLLHEFIHQYGLRDPSDGWLSADPTQRYFEEAVAEAIARDLLPTYLRYFWGHRYRELKAAMSRDEETKRLRAVSVFGSSTASKLGRWNQAPAIAWRADFARAGYAERAAMIADAAAKQAAKAWKN